MTVQPVAANREQIPDLLTRPPNGTREFVSKWSHLMVDPVRQLTVLADLYAMGLLSDEEYAYHKQYVRRL